MKLIYNNAEISVTQTNNNSIMRYKHQKLYYAIIINNCNSYSSIASKQRVDVIMTDDNYKILSIKREMHENTIYKNENASKTILIPLNTFPNLQINTYFTIK